MRTKHVVFLSLLVGACTQHPKIDAGNLAPVTFIETSKQQTVIDKVMEVCSSQGFTIEESTNNAVVCSRQSGTGAQFLMGSVGGTSVVSKLRVSAFPSQGKIKVVGSGWFERQNFYGKIDRTPGGNAEVQAILDQTKREIDEGHRK